MAQAYRSNRRAGKPLPNAAMSELLKGMGNWRDKFGEEITAHGFRSSFRDWGGDKTHYPRDLLEFALGHKVGDEAEVAYRRSDRLEKRRRLMEDWADRAASASGSTCAMTWCGFLMGLSVSSATRSTSNSLRYSPRPWWNCSVPSLRKTLNDRAGGLEAVAERETIPAQTLVKLCAGAPFLRNASRNSGQRLFRFPDLFLRLCVVSQFEFRVFNRVHPRR
jgi:hypothetical protein